LKEFLLQKNASTDATARNFLARQRVSRFNLRRLKKKLTPPPAWTLSWGTIQTLQRFQAGLLCRHEFSSRN
jgi:predicted deacetylase